MSTPHTVENEPALVLVVDDNATTRYLLGTYLRRGGHQVLEADTGAQALSVIATQPVDIVILDVHLPDTTGFEVCEQIKNDPETMRPVIHVSATAIGTTDRARGLNRGADAYLTEPVEPEELLATVAAILRSYRARAAAERMSRALRGLTETTVAMNSASSVEALAACIAHGAAEVLGLPVSATLALPDGQLHRVTTAPGGHPVHDLAPTQTAVPQPSGGDPIGIQPVRWALAANSAHRDPDNDDAPGTMVLARSRTSRAPVTIAVRIAALNVEQTQLLKQLAQAAALAADSLRLYLEEHSLALTLQRSFLPDIPTNHAGVQIAARYVPAARNSEIGGDFYEIIELDEDRLLIAIGDVAGHSVHAGTVMVELRHALRAFVLEPRSPSEMLDLLDRTLRTYHRYEYATLCLAILDIRNNHITVSNAGHIPPLLVGPGGAAQYLPVAGCMLGVGRPARPATTIPLPPAWALVLLTDGLIEEPGADLDEALDELRNTVSLELAPEQLCTVLLERFGRSRRDDIALLALRGGPNQPGLTG
jgi:serine phosphatase RsbU (regulator of sigma subunit)/CheY-like chemotaxis protein